MSRTSNNWLLGVATVLVTALIIGIGTTLASDHDKITRFEEALPRIEAKIDEITSRLPKP